MSLAFLITAHQQPAQLAMLLRQIQHPDCICLVQPDSKTLSGTEPALQAVVREFSNVYIAPARDMRWASWSLMSARLDGIATLLKRSEPWQTLVMLSGQDFPLQKVETMMATFAGKPDHSWIDLIDPLTTWDDPYARPQRLRLELPFMKSGFTVPRVRIDRWAKHLGKARYMGGSPWMALSRAFCQHLIDSPDLPDWKAALTNSYRPDQVLIHSFLANSPFADKVVNQKIHEEQWGDDPSHPRVLTMADRELLEKSPFPFARKFDISVDRSILEHLQQRLG